MTRFYFDEQSVESIEGETVLDALIRQGHSLNYSCRKGACKTCLVQHIGGDIPSGAQRGLTSELKSDAYLCACQCKPTQDLKLKSILVQNLFIAAHIHEKQYLSDSVVKILVEPSEEMSHSAGQYINLRRFDGLTRSYSITNDPDSKLIELHIRRKYNGQFSDWLFNHASVGESVLIQGPWGDCCYRSEYKNDTLILIGTGTGLGPVYGIIRDALSQGHKGEIYLYHGAKNEADLYHHSKLLKLMLEHRNMTYLACVEQMGSGKSSTRVQTGDPFEVAMSFHQFDSQTLSDSPQRVFLCGEPSFVNKGQELVFLNGTPLDRIHSLSYEYKDLRKVPRDGS
ncbi:2Fe-2S iron-sulfur cluster-binding protein [Shewanella nanhaiensis]|uniref:2Fe-2S iron-sulfur cluster binding domain-containing protein n=1 Tax=Shewanella nanhaiensis TaxID=2864872 RepID=A0ABS7E8M9_9GAMM|nr:2Fe-2S iron-sulfur cluster-binding protein [Shewanella nanhaiensis]MBW8185905.1 2Fe-2S iron-sulfur cluster binding domain-containing protein [Shewanella nanhaiensis]